MTQLQQAILCATLDVRESDEANFVDWHTREHLVERLGISGFLRGRRFVRENASPRYLILYDVQSLAVLSQPDYVERLNNPTPWTRATLPTFCNGQRSAYRMVARKSQGEGAFMMLLRMSPGEVAPQEWEIGYIACDEWSKRPGIVGVSFAIPDQHASTLDTEESRQSGNRFAEEWLLLVEGTSERSLLNLARSELTRMVSERWGLSNVDSPQIFQLQVRMGREGAE
jgi:hypothetical protein